MKVVHIIPSMNSGGAEKMLMRLIFNGSDKIKHSIIVLDQIGFYKEELIEKNISILELNIKKNNLFLTIFYLYKLHKEIRSFLKDVDLISSWMYHSNVLGLIYGKILKKPIIWGVRRSYIEKKNMKKSTYLVIKINAILSKYVTKIIYNSLEGKRTHLNFGFSQNNSKYIPNGFEINKLGNYEKKDNSTFKIINVARWEPLKDHKNLLKSISDFKKKTNINFEVLLCGKNIDNFNETLLTWIREYDLISEVKLLGERKDVDLLMQSADVYVSTSISEGFPNVIAEAMLNNLICIATNAGDSANIINNKNFIVDIGNVKAITDLITYVSEMDFDERIILGRNNRKEIIERYSIDKIVQEFEHTFVGKKI